MANGHGSDVQETPDWWMASDGRWYPPELHPDYQAGPAAEVKPEADATAPSDAAERSAPSLSERLRAAADRLGEQVSDAADEVGEAAAAAADQGAGSTGAAATAATARLAGAAATTAGASGDDSADPGGLGHSAGSAGSAGSAASGVRDTVGESIQDRIAGARSTLDDAVDATVPKVVQIDGQPEVVASAADLARGTQSSAEMIADPRATVIEPATPSVPEVPASPSVPDVAASVAVPEVPAPPSVPEVPASPSLPDAAGSVAVPEVPAPPSLPDAAASVAVPEAGEVPSPPVSEAPRIASPEPPAPLAPPAPAAGLGAAPPSALGDPPRGDVVQGPGGITYTAPPEPTASGVPLGSTPASAYPAEGAVAAPVTKRASRTAGIVALVAGAATIVGSLLQWGKGTIDSAAGVERAVIEVAGFDSSGLLTAICGAALVVLALLFFAGIPRQLFWAIAAFIGGGIIVGAVVFSMIDIADLSERYRQEWQATGLASRGDVVTTQADLGLWITGAGGVLGVLAAPFVNRD